MFRGDVIEMSMQTDVEILAVQAMETYAIRKKMASKEVNDLFHKHQVFEKIILQYEYLHQISFEEVMEFIEKSIEEESKELVLFHGMIDAFDEVMLEKSHNRRDFGSGFYTTILEQQAKEWAYRLSLRKKVKKYYVYQFVFWESDTLKIRRFDALNKEWLEFIKENRSKGGVQHKYDVVIGPVADDNTMETVQLYIAGILTADEAVKRLRYSKVNNQVSFHTEKALQSLRLVGRECYE